MRIRPTVGSSTLARTARLAVVLVTAAVAAAAQAGEIVIENTGVERMLLDHLYTDEGRYHLVPRTRCQYAYLESPKVTIAGGRLQIATLLSGRFALDVNGTCAGPSDAFEVTVSGKPFFQGEKLGLTDIRIDRVSKEAYRPLLQQVLAAGVSSAVAIDLREGLQRMLASGGTTYTVRVDGLSVTDIVAENNRLRANLAFAITAY
jgi:hypothetical protein